jgi:hypothetical protein
MFLHIVFKDSAANTCMSHLMNLLFIACHNSGTEIIDTATWLNIPGFKFWQKQKIFLFSNILRLALGPTQPPNPWVLGFFPGG